jgi:type IV secretion system protein VirB9
MIRAVLFALLLATGLPAHGQTFPTPGDETPRVQTAEWRDRQTIVLIALPETALTVMLEPGERIARATLTGLRQWDVSVSPEADTFQVRPQAGAAPARLAVETDRRAYEFALEVGEGVLAAYLVQLKYGGGTARDPAGDGSKVEGLSWSYRLRGDRSVRPASIHDNGEKTVIEYAPGQPLPAVFAIGATGEEEVVDGHMRGDRFVIDRVHQELVFRIDKDKATARRNREEDSVP